MMKKIILIAGPTASGKSSLANILAKKINGEIVNADWEKAMTRLHSEPTSMNRSL